MSNGLLFRVPGGTKREAGLASRLNAMIHFEDTRLPKVL
jgi:hypothetical protein